MAEVLGLIGVVASVAQLADYGFKLSTKLYAYSSAVSKADKSIASLSTEVSFTSTVLNELSRFLSEGEEAKYVSRTAVEATQGTVRECLDVFRELDVVLERALSGSGEKGKGGEKGKMKLGERLKWPFMQPKVDLLRSNLDRLKASLTLMLQVLGYARDIASRKKDQESLAYQKVVIENLSKAEKEATKKYRELQKLIEAAESQQVQHHTFFANNTIMTGVTSRPPTAPPPYAQDKDATAGATIAAHSVAAPQEKPQYSKPHAGELMLLFNLIQNLMRQHIPNTASISRRRAYKELRAATEDAENTERKILKRLYGPEVIYKVGIEAEENAAHLHAQLRDLASRHAHVFLVKETSEETVIKSPGSRHTTNTWKETAIEKQLSKIPTHPVDDHRNDPRFSRAYSMLPITDVEPIATDSDASSITSSDHELGGFDLGMGIPRSTFPDYTHTSASAHFAGPQSINRQGNSSPIQGEDHNNLENDSGSERWLDSPGDEGKIDLNQPGASTPASTKSAYLRLDEGGIGAHPSLIQKQLASNIPKPGPEKSIKKVKHLRGSRGGKKRKVIKEPAKVDKYPQISDEQRPNPEVAGTYRENSKQKDNNQTSNNELRPVAPPASAAPIQKFTPFGVTDIKALPMGDKPTRLSGGCDACGIRDVVCDEGDPCKSCVSYWGDMLSDHPCARDGLTTPRTVQGLESWLSKPRPNGSIVPTHLLGDGNVALAHFHRNEVDVETLNYFGLPWGYDPTDADYYFIFQKLDEKEMEVLFEHTRKLKKGATQLLIEDRGRGHYQHRYAFVRRRPGQRTSSTSPKRVSHSPRFGQMKRPLF
jgi:hypothetical protein